MSVESTCPPTAQCVRRKAKYALPNANAKANANADADADANEVHFHKSDGSGKFIYNYGVDCRAVDIHDIRGREGEFSLDANGFEYVIRENSNETDRPDEIQQLVQEMRQLVQKHTGAVGVDVDSFLIRPRNDGRPPVVGNPSQSTSDRQEPLVDVDPYPESIASPTRNISEDPVAGDPPQRKRVICAWLPIELEAHDEFLGVVDWKTSSDDPHFIPLRLDPKPGSPPTVWLARYSQRHAWYYMSHQTPSQVTLIKCYDSDETKAKFCLHSHFSNSNCPGSALRRRSIEVRMLVTG